MIIEERQKKILYALKTNPEITVKQLSAELYVSEPTVRRDLTELEKRKLLKKRYGGAVLQQGAADMEIPFLLRESKQGKPKDAICRQAAKLVSDGMVIMLDASTTVYHIVPYLTKFKDLIVVTSGAKTAVALAEAKIKTFSTGGQMIINSFSYVGEQAENFVKHINADILFFSCHGLNEKGNMTERSIEEARIRRAMFENCNYKVLLCDSEKFEKTYFYNMGNLSEINAIISETEIPKMYTDLLINPESRKL